MTVISNIHFDPIGSFELYTFLLFNVRVIKRLRSFEYIQVYYISFYITLNKPLNNNDLNKKKKSLLQAHKCFGTPDFKWMRRKNKVISNRYVCYNSHLHIFHIIPTSSLFHFSCMKLTFYFIFTFCRTLYKNAVNFSFSFTVDNNINCIQVALKMMSDEGRKKIQSLSTWSDDHFYR